MKTPYYSPWFLAKNRKVGFRRKTISSERAPQEEQNGTDFSSVPPSSGVLWVWKERTVIYIEHLIIAVLDKNVNIKGACVPLSPTLGTWIYIHVRTCTCMSVHVHTCTYMHEHVPLPHRPSYVEGVLLTGCGSCRQSLGA